ncbi:MAG: methylenetetrahydrofolate reductase [Actinomycetes bacterium]
MSHNSALPTVSFEFFPPKDAAGQASLNETLSSLAHHSPAFVSVTYGAGGSTRDRTLTVAASVMEQLHCPVIGHLTLVGSTQEELSAVLTQYLDIGITGVLALRGDPVGGPTAPWVTTPGGFDYAEQLVQLISSTTCLEIAVAAFPDVHPASQGNFIQDIQALLRKEQLGATMAITQFVFDSGRYEALCDALESHGSQLRIYPGIMPVTNYNQIVRMLELSGGYMPKATRLRFARFQNDPESLKKLGIDIAVQICEDVIALGAPGLHFYTLNQSGPTNDVITSLSVL